MKPRRKTIAVDFDGVIHSYLSPWTSPECISDPPVPGALSFLQEAVARFDVVIFSVRAQHETGVRAIAWWLVHHGLPQDVVAQLRITHEKPKAIVYLDDRAWRFTGQFPSLDQLDAAVPWNRRSHRQDGMKHDATSRGSPSLPGQAKTPRSGLEQHRGAAARGSRALSPARRQASACRLRAP